MMKKGLIFRLGLILLVAACFGLGIQTTVSLAGQSSHRPYDTEGTGEFVPGGRNVEAYNYVHSPGYPPFSDRVDFIGTLTGTWYKMGYDFGKRSGEKTRYVSDIWWKEECTNWGKEQTLKAIGLYEKQIAALDPHQVEFMKGIAAGAEEWLNQSIYADGTNPLYASNYDRVLAVNIYDEWNMIHPSIFPDGTSTYGGSRTAPPVLGLAPCSAFAAKGAATVDGKAIASHNRHTPYDPRVYEQAYVISPPGLNTAWVLTNCPQVSANQVVNNKGLSIILLFGGVSNPKSWGAPGGPYFAEAFGVPWFNLFLYVGTHANNANEAIQMLTVGPKEYRDRTGRNSLLRGGGWIFPVADADTLAVVEVSADRYAVRYPGEHTGADWTSPDYIVSTNHSHCNFSYDKDNNLTNVPMTIFNVLPLSDVRFATLMWDMKHRYGKIDRYMAQHIMAGRYAHDAVTGEKQDCATSSTGKIGLFGDILACNEGTGTNLVTGTNDGKIAVLDGADTSVFWTLGNPSDWEGAWDAYYFKPRASH